MKQNATCKNCHSENVVITIQYHKSTICRVLKFICIIGLLLTVILNMAEVIQYDDLGNKLQTPENTYTIQNVCEDITPINSTINNQPSGYVKVNPTGFIILALILVLTLIEFTQQYFESKMRIYYYCKDCGEIWHENEPTN